MEKRKSQNNMEQNYKHLGNKKDKKILKAIQTNKEYWNSGKAFMKKKRTQHKMIGQERY